MRKIIKASSLLFIVAIFILVNSFNQPVGHAAQKYHTYYNNRFGFTIQIPSGFKAGPPPTNGDGLEFSNKESSITAYGFNNFDDFSAKSYFQNYDRPYIKEKITYQKFTKNSYVISYKKGNKIIYRNVRIGSDSGNAFEIVYPANKQKTYGPIVSYIYKTFKTPNLNESY
ncbi:hypothetical protein [Gottfriedia luciferensis]|uniref:hypothetical protein n=1 Tax=Gottfriedia luciferensis TaxID=178774 RepID=UPI000B43B8E6|nr:hypothetical protein [Gottfriedia luciferensis]